MLKKITGKKIIKTIKNKKNVILLQKITYFNSLCFYHILFYTNTHFNT